MASTALSLHLRRNTLSKNPNSVKLFSSSSSFPPPPPPQNDTDETTPSNHSQSQSQSSFSSYFKDLKSNLKQPQQPFQQTQQPPSQFQQTYQRSPNQFQQTPPTKAASFDEIRKNLSEFRSRTAAPPPRGLNNSETQSQFPNSGSGGSNISFQELYRNRKNVESRGEASSENAGSMGTAGKMGYDMIRESLKQLRMNKPVEVNKGSKNNVLGGYKLTDSLLGNTKLDVYGGGSLPANVFGKEGSKKKEGESGKMKTKFLRMYTYGDLGEKLKMLRPEEAKENKGKWFSLKELSERLIKLRDIEEKEAESATDTKIYTGLRESLQKLASDGDDKKKSSEEEQAGGLAIEEETRQGEEQVFNGFDAKLCVVGRFISEGQIDFLAMRQTLAALWKPGMGLYIKDLEANLFLFQFYHEVDVKRVMEGCPWSFNKRALIMSRLKEGENPRSVSLNSMDLWVQVYDLKTRFMSERILKEIGNHIGSFVASAPTNFVGVWRDFLRVRVTIDITKPLKRKMKISSPGNDCFWISFKYENIPTFCFICGILGHSEKFCSQLFGTPKKEIVRPYGGFLRAPFKKHVKPIGAQWLPNNMDGKEGSINSGEHQSQPKHCKLQ